MYTQTNSNNLLSLLASLPLSLKLSKKLHSKASLNSGWGGKKTPKNKTNKKNQTKQLSGNLRKELFFITVIIID